VIIKTCPQCGKQFETPQNKTKYCSRACVGASQKGGASVQCAHCGESFYAPPSRAERAEAMFCSRACSNEAIAKQRSKGATCLDCGAPVKEPARNKRCEPCKEKRRAGIPGPNAWEALMGKSETLIAKLAECSRCKKFKLKAGALEGWICRECRTQADERTWANRRAAAKYHRTKNDPGKHLRMVMRISVRQCLKGEKKRRRTFDLLGYSVEALREHLEKRMAHGMTWSNYGKAWHIDHIVPMRVFNITSPDDPDFKRAWALSNLRPLWAAENLRKGGRVEKPVQPSLAWG
jgi:hypothetical protein